MRTPRRVGAHVPAKDLTAELARRDGDVAQVFLSSPRSWAPPKPSTHPHLAEAGLPVFAHAPYLANPASGDPHVRHKTRDLVVATLRRADELGLAGVVVHGGHATADATPADGLDGWRDLLRYVEAADVRTPLLIENTATGDQAMARTLEQLYDLWQVVSTSTAPVGFCLDTCHTFAGDASFADDPDRWLADLLTIVDHIDLVHVNGSKASAGARRDRHANLGADDDLMTSELVSVQLRWASGTPAVVETPGGADAQRRDVRRVRELDET